MQPETTLFVDSVCYHGRAGTHWPFCVVLVACPAEYVEPPRESIYAGSWPPDPSSANAGARSEMMAALQHTVELIGAEVWVAWADDTERGAPTDTLLRACQWTAFSLRQRGKFVVELRASLFSGAAEVSAASSTPWQMLPSQELARSSLRVIRQLEAGSGLPSAPEPRHEQVAFGAADTPLLAVIARWTADTALRQVLLEQGMRFGREIEDADHPRKGAARTQVSRLETFNLGAGRARSLFEVPAARLAGGVLKLSRTCAEETSTPLQLARAVERIARDEACMSSDTAAVAAAKLVEEHLVFLAQRAHDDPAERPAISASTRQWLAELEGVADARAGDFEACERSLRWWWDKETAGPALLEHDAYATARGHVVRARVANHRGDADRADSSLMAARLALQGEQSLRALVLRAEVDNLAVVAVQNRFPFAVDDSETAEALERACESLLNTLVDAERRSDDEHRVEKR
jgi:hypothetical protein